jgi:hypothetical protein
VYPQSNLKGQQGFSWLLQTRRKARKPSAQEEQLQLLRQILAELQKLNASLASGRAGMQSVAEPDRPTYDSGDDELEEYE